jgi:hypothetical protein
LNCHPFFASKTTLAPLPAFNMDCFTMQGGELPFQICNMFLPPVPMDHPDGFYGQDALLLKTIHDTLTQFRALCRRAEAAETRRLDRCVRMLSRMADQFPVLHERRQNENLRADKLWRQIADLEDNGGCFSSATKTPCRDCTHWDRERESQDELNGCVRQDS